MIIENMSDETLMYVKSVNVVSANTPFDEKSRRDFPEKPQQTQLNGFLSNSAIVRVRGKIIKPLFPSTGTLRTYYAKRLPIGFKSHLTQLRRTEMNILNFC